MDPDLNDRMSGCYFCSQHTCKEEKLQVGNKSNTEARTKPLSSLARLTDPALGQGQRMQLTSKGSVRSKGQEGQRKGLWREEGDQASHCPGTKCVVAISVGTQGGAVGVLECGRAVGAGWKREGTLDA